MPDNAVISYSGYYGVQHSLLTCSPVRVDSVYIAVTSD